MWHLQYDGGPLSRAYGTHRASNACLPTTLDEAIGVGMFLLNFGKKSHMHSLILASVNNFYDIWDTVSTCKEELPWIYQLTDKDTLNFQSFLTPAL